MVDSYCDADWAGDVKNRKSTSGYLFRVFGNVVQWKCRQQNSVAISSNEAELLAASEACSETIWFRGLLNDLGYKIRVPTPITIFEDNQGCISLSNNQDIRTVKHIAIRAHFLRDFVEKGEVILKHVSSKDQLADILTKPLAKPAFEKLRTQLRIKP